MQLTGIGLCLELNREALSLQLTCTGFCLELNRAGVRREVNRYRFVFGTERSKLGVCSKQVPVCVWNSIEQAWSLKLTGIGLCLELSRAGVERAVNRYRFVYRTE